MIISHGRRYIFVHAPKTGGTSMKLALEARARADDIITRLRRSSGANDWRTLRLRGVCANTAPCAILMGLWMYLQCRIISYLPSGAIRGTAWSVIITGRANKVLIIPLFGRRRSMTSQSFASPRCLASVTGVPISQLCSGPIWRRSLQFVCALGTSDIGFGPTSGSSGVSH